MLKAIGAITGEIERLNPSISITNNLAIMGDPRMIELQDGLLGVARRVPEARGPIVELLRKLDQPEPSSPARTAPALIEGEVVAG